MPFKSTFSNSKLLLSIHLFVSLFYSINNISIIYSSSIEKCINSDPSKDISCKSKMLLSLTIQNAELQESDYVESRVDMNAYMIFSPVFFVNIGVSLPYETIADSFNATMVLFSIAFVIMALLGKFIGAGIGAKVCNYTWDESIKVGLSMMVRGEVCLIIANEGVKTGIMSQEYYPAFVLLIIVSSILTPVLLKFLYKKYPEKKIDNSMLSEDPIAVASNEPDKGV